MNRKTITYKQLAYLIDYYQIEPNETSPILRYKDRLTELENFDLDKAFIGTLMQPKGLITLRFGGGTKRASEQVICYGEKVVGFQFEKEVTVFEYSDPLEIADLIVKNYANKSEYASHNILPPSCGLDEFVCVLNSIDMYRKLYYTSMLAHKRNQAMGFKATDFTEQFSQSVNSRDIRWLTPCFMTIVPNLKLVDMTDDSMSILLDQNLCQLMKNNDTGEVGLYFTENGKALGLEFERTWSDTLGFEFTKGTEVITRGLLAITALSNHFIEIGATVNHQSFQYEQLHLKLEDLIKKIL